MIFLQWIQIQQLQGLFRAARRVSEFSSIRCNSSTGRVTLLGLGGVRNEEQQGDWYLNASLFLPFQQLYYLSLARNRIAGWVEKKGLLS